MTKSNDSKQPADTKPGSASKAKGKTSPVTNDVSDKSNYKSPKNPKRKPNADKTKSGGKAEKGGTVTPPTGVKKKDAEKDSTTDTEKLNSKPIEKSIKVEKRTDETVIMIPENATQNSVPESNDCVIDIGSRTDPTQPAGNIPGTVLSHNDDGQENNEITKKSAQMNPDEGVRHVPEPVVYGFKLDVEGDAEKCDVTDQASNADPVGGKPQPQVKLPEPPKPAIEVSAPKSPNKDVGPINSSNSCNAPQNDSAVEGKLTSESSGQKNNETKGVDKKALDTSPPGKEISDKGGGGEGKGELVNNNVKPVASGKKLQEPQSDIVDKPGSASSNRSTGKTTEKKDKKDDKANKTKAEQKSVKPAKETSKPGKVNNTSGKGVSKGVGNTAAAAAKKVDPEPPPPPAAVTSVSTPPTSARAKWMKLQAKHKEIIMLESPRTNGTRPGLNRTESLTVPGKDGESSSGSPKSLRRGSSRSIDSKVSSIDLTKIAANINSSDGEKENEDNKNRLAATSDNYLKNAIPYLPVPVAILLLMLNMMLPGFGTMLSGVCVFCCGRPRVQTKDDHVMLTVCINLWVGVAQLFTVTFMLVGWVWSFAWGIYMVILAVEKQREVKAHRQKELQAKALTALNSQIRPWTLRT